MQIVEDVEKRIKMADEWSKATGYPPHQYFDALLDLRSILVELARLREQSKADRETISRRDNAALVASSRALHLKETLDHMVANGSCIVAGQPYPKSCADRIAAEAELIQEQNRHIFTVQKWMRERKELTDELVNTRSELSSLRKELAMLKELIRCDKYDGSSLSEMANSALRKERDEAVAAISRMVQKECDEGCDLHEAYKHSQFCEEMRDIARSVCPSVPEKPTEHCDVCEPHKCVHFNDLGRNI